MKFEEQRPPPGKLQYFVAWTAVAAILILHDLHQNMVTGALYGVLCFIVFAMALGVGILLFGDNLSAKLQAITVLRRPMPLIARIDYVIALFLAGFAAGTNMVIFAVLQFCLVTLGLGLRWRLIRLSDAYRRGLN